MSSDCDDFYDAADDFQLVESIRPLCICVNQRGTRFAVGHERGFIVYAVPEDGGASDTIGGSGGVGGASSSSIKEIFRHETLKEGERGQGGVGHVALLFETHNYAIVGGGAWPLMPLNQVRMMVAGSAMATVSMPNAVRSVCLVPNKVLILSETFFKATNFRGEELIAAMPAMGGPLASPPVVLAPALLAPLCAMPAGPATPGGVAVINFDTQRVVSTFRAHHTAISCLALSGTGRLVATASQRGTLFRVWEVGAAAPDSSSSAADAPPATQVAEVRNSAFGRAVRHLQFAERSDHVLALCGTALKIFFVGKKEEVLPHHAFTRDPRKEPAKNTSSRLASLGAVSSYFSSEWACSEAAIPGEATAGLEARCSRLAFEVAKGGSAAGSGAGSVGGGGVAGGTQVGAVAFGFSSMLGWLPSGFGGFGNTGGNDSSASSVPATPPPPTAHAATSSRDTAASEPTTSSGVVRGSGGGGSGDLADGGGDAGAERRLGGATGEVTHYTPLQLDDFLVPWWTRATRRVPRTAGGTSPPPPPPQTPPGASPARDDEDVLTICVATAEGLVLRFAFGASTGTLELRSRHYPL